MADDDKLTMTFTRVEWRLLAIAAMKLRPTDVIEGHLDAINKEQARHGEFVESIDAGISHVSLWFEKSKLWEGRLL